jgi:hypothetical protein
MVENDYFQGKQHSASGTQSAAKAMNNEQWAMNSE